MRYARALLAYANENGVADKVYMEVLQLSKAFTRVAELRVALDNPVLSAATKVELIHEAVGGQASPELTRFIELVLAERRVKFLPFMLMSYIDLYRKQENISTGEITTACPVSDHVIDRIRALVVEHTHGTVELKTRVDPGLEGGFIFEIGTYRLDASVANQIKRVRQQFIENNRRIV